MAQTSRTRGWCQRARTVALLALAGLPVLSGPTVADDPVSGGGGDASTLGEGVSGEEAIWREFVRHLEQLGRTDLLADSAAASGESAHADHPDFWRGDPILPCLFGLSRELVRLDAMFPRTGDEIRLKTARDEEPGPDPGQRLEKIRSLVGIIEESDDPYLEAYGRLYAARAAQEVGDHEGAVEILESLVGSRHFLARGEAHRHLAESYLALKDATLATLELQLHLADLDETRSTERQWALDRLEALRESAQRGPLEDSVERARAVASLIRETNSGDAVPAESSFRQQATEGQRDVEAILERTLQLLETQSSRCDKHASPEACRRAGCAGGSTGGVSPEEPSPEDGPGQGKPLEGQQRLEKVLEKVIVLMEGSARRCPACKQKPCDGSTAECKTATVAGQGPGSRRSGSQNGPQNEAGNGDPENDENPENPARDTRITKGTAGEVDRRDAATDQEAWGRINDREVARSLRELWGKIPVAYRQLVAQYFRDISDLEPETDR